MANEDESATIDLGPEFQVDESLFGVSDALHILGVFIVNTPWYAGIKTFVCSKMQLNICREGESEPTIVAAIATILSGIVAVWFLLYFFSSFQNKSHNSDSSDGTTKEETEEPVLLRDFTIEQLREFDGKDNSPIYIALRGDVYDVSMARDLYGEGSGYNCFAGREASRAMAKLSFEESELSCCDTDDLGPFERSTLDDWIEKFKYYKCYPIVGKVTVTPILQKSFNLEELASSKIDQPTPAGRINAPILVGINGKVIDVSYGGHELYCKGGPYFIFSGIDASRALAKMSFSPEDLANRDLSDLSESEKKVLEDWEKKFIVTRKYPVVGYISEN